MTAQQDPIQLEVFKHRFAAVAEEMGLVLKKASYSPNIKERRDYSCAIFNGEGKMIAQAAHIPVHLGSMPMSVKAAVDAFPKDLFPGDVIILNDPFSGGTHLPDITLVTPVFINDENNANEKYPFAFVATRAHHADVGGMTPGSMPVATEIYQEGLIIPPIKLVSRGEIEKDILNLILANVRTPNEREGDIWAQIAANHRGEQRLVDMFNEFGSIVVDNYMSDLLSYTERMTRELLKKIPNGEYEFSDKMDNDGISDEPVSIKVRITIKDDSAKVDFAGSAQQQTGSINAVYAITLSAVYYVFRCLLDLDVPNNEGCLSVIEVVAPEGSVVNAVHPVPVAGGNVETSQRIVDVLLGALAKAVPDRIPAASQGTMNNVTIGGVGGGTPFTYYETIGGGIGASPDGDGPSGVHSHMTNTLNTPVEALEFAYPLRVLKYEIREKSGGTGKYSGGKGICRDIEMQTDVQVTLLTERRDNGPYGIDGGQPGEKGMNLMIHNGKETLLPGKGTFTMKSGDVLSICTPGGGGYGKPEVDPNDPD